MIIRTDAATVASRVIRRNSVKHLVVEKIRTTKRAGTNTEPEEMPIMFLMPRRRTRMQTKEKAKERKEKARERNQEKPRL